MTLIVVENLEKTYSTDGVKTPALRGVSFRIQKGEFVAIMGPSGSGKSTLLHVLGFLEGPTKGSYRFEGKSFADYSKEEIARVRNQKMGFVFQTFNLLPRTTVLDNVILPLMYSDRKESSWNNLATGAVASVGLSHRIQYDVSHLSGGEKQRVAIARALVNNPDVIFADEPTGNLDSQSGELVMTVLKKLNREHNHTIMLITHEAVIAKYAERIIHLKDGRIEL